MGYYLVDNENPNASLRENGKKGNYYPRRSRAIQGIVVHTAEGGTDAMAIANYLSKTDRVASAHVVIDNKNIVNLSIIPYLNDTDSILYHINTTFNISHINFESCHFILYND